MLEIINADITKQNVDIIVNASNGIGPMGAGVAGAIKRAGGVEIEDECYTYCKIYNPQPGHVYLTKAGTLPSNKVMHAVTMKFPGTSYRREQEKGLLIVKNLVNRVLRMFKESEFNSLAMPAFATGVGGLDTRDVAEIFIRGVRYYGFHNDDNPKKVIICDIDYNFTDWCEVWFDKFERDANE